MRVRYHKIKNIFWGIQDADKESGKNLGWIKATKGPSGKMGECYLAHIKAGQWPHPGNRIVKKGILTNVKLKFFTIACGVPAESMTSTLRWRVRQKIIAPYNCSKMGSCCWEITRRGESRSTLIGSAFMTS